MQFPGNKATIIGASVTGLCALGAGLYKVMDIVNIKETKRVYAVLVSTLETAHAKARSEKNTAMVPDLVKAEAYRDYMERYVYEGRSYPRLSNVKKVLARISVL